MTAGQITEIAVIAACGLVTLVATLCVALLLAAEVYLRVLERRQPRRQAGGRDPDLAPGVAPAGLPTHNFSMVESTIPDGMTIHDWRRVRFNDSRARY